MKIPCSALLASCALFVACSSPSKAPALRDITSFDVATAGLVNGKTTEATFISTFGPPQSQKGGAKEHETTWKFLDGRVLIAIFTNNGVLIESSYGEMKGTTFVNLSKAKPPVRPAEPAE
jgi:hypothetical protein